MISAKNIMNIKVVELIKIYNFYFDHLFIQQRGSIHCSQIYMSDEEMTKIKWKILINSTTFMFKTFLAEIIYCFKMLFEVAIF